MKFIFNLIITLAVVTNADAQFLLRPYAQSSVNTQNNASTEVPDYSNLYYWAANPDKKSISDSIPAFVHDVMGDKPVDVFFLHPTTYVKGFRSVPMNANVDDQQLNNETDERTILYQASVFNGTCRIFAPRYRQAHIRAFFNRDSEESRQAFDLAYADLRRAFQYYLDHYNHGRPIIIASHSQGTLHAIRLVKEFFDGKPLQKQLVCAYLIGYQIKRDAFTTVPLCNSATATGCFVGWRSYKTGFIAPEVAAEGGNSQCVNPISWTTTSTYADKQQHLGMLGKDFNVYYPQTAAAQIDANSKVLFVDVPQTVDDKLGRINNYHILDYNLFYMDIRNNVKQRAAAYFNAKH